MDGIVGRVAIGVGASAVIAGVALARRALSISGAGAAVLIGTCIFVGGGAQWFAGLGTFFVTSTLLARVGRARKEATKLEFSKGDRRDAWQAVANGGVAAGAAVAMAIAPSRMWEAAFLGALAAANGDTWATEIGVLSRGEPISLVRWKKVARGTSGAVSATGLVATIVGATLIGVVMAVWGREWRLVALATVAGTIGSIVDSLLGATLQAGFWCEGCGKETEAEVHHCGGRGRLVRGVGWIGNDVVNVVATVAGAGVAVGLAYFL